MQAQVSSRTSSRSRNSHVFSTSPWYDGYYGYEGRADDVIISAGYRIGPFEVESACLEHAAVREAAAVASQDERRGHIVKIFVVLADGHAPSDALAQELQQFVRRCLAYSLVMPTTPSCTRSPGDASKPSCLQLAIAPDSWRN